MSNRKTRRKIPETVNRRNNADFSALDEVGDP
jgi:hypothetical protein